MLQLLKSERWNFAVFEVALCVAVGELHAELMGLPGLRCCVPSLRGMAARELRAELVRVARRVLLHAATLLRARGACPATVLLRAAPARPLCSCVRRRRAYSAVSAAL